MKMPTPSKRYKAIQKKMQTLKLDSTGEGPTPGDLRRKLEAQFAKAWGLSPDEGRGSYRLRFDLERISGKDHLLDHCSYFISSDFRRVIVTQPYFDASKKLEEALTLGGWGKPQITRAKDWAYYSPGKADLIILEFPNGYSNAVKALNRMSR